VAAGPRLGARLAQAVRRRVHDPLLRLYNRREDFDFRLRQDELIVYHHLGLGDHFICMGLVLELADRFAQKRVHLATKRPYVGTVQALYARAPNVRILPVDPGQAEREVYAFARREGLKVARLGFDGLDPSQWDRSFYDQAGIDFRHSWDRFDMGDVRAEADALSVRLVESRPYMLVHADGSVGSFTLRISGALPRVQVRPEPSPVGLLAWCRIINEAEEIHCIDSSVVHLVDRLPEVPGQSLFLHDARKSGCRFTRRRNWHLVPYPG
jgi:hypothetical protein